MAENEFLIDTDLSEFDSTVNSDGDMTHDSGSIDGHAGRMRCLIDDTTAIYVISALTSPGNEYRYRLYLSNGLSLASGNTLKFLFIPDDNNAMHQVQFRNNGGTIELSAFFYNDGFASSNQTNVALGSHLQIEGHCKRETSDGAADGFCKIYGSASFGSPIINITGVDNYNIWASSNGNPDSFRLGAITMSSGITGSAYFTRVLFNNTGTQIGSHASSAAPTVTNISNQTGVFGIQKSVACTIADTDSDIVRCDVSTDGSCLITLTASGVATVTNNGTTAPYVTGTHTDVVATLGNNIKLDRAESWPSRSASETITVLVTDDLDATGNDTFTMTWGIATGVGTKAIKLTGTYAQIIAALPTIEWTPTTDFTGTTQVNMYSLTSTPLDDTDTFNITVNEQQGTGLLSSIFIVNVRRRRR